MKYLFIILAVLTLQACKTDPEKYELKSPCVAADSESPQAPCQRRAVNVWMG